MSGILVHMVELVGLGEAVPSAEIAWVGVDGRPIRLDCSGNVLHLEVFVAHQSPRRYERLVELNRTHEIKRRFGMIASQTVIISNDAAAFGPIFVILEQVESEST